MISFLFLVRFFSFNSIPPYPKSRRRNPCSNNFREVTHRLLYFEVC
jgi:hypothetical protein